MENNTKWPILKNAPIIMAIFQIQFEPEGFDVPKYLNYDTVLKRYFPNRSENIHTDLKVPGTIALGVSKIDATSDVSIKGYTYFTKDQKKKLLLERGSITYTDENKYIDWETFVSDVFKFVGFFDLLQNHKIIRTSIRFINQFIFDEFDNSTDYFNIAISTPDENVLKYPVKRYGFNLTCEIPDSNTYAIINHNLETISTDKFSYIFDIDVLDRSNLIFNLDSINDILIQLRNIKNEIFFSSITQKTINLCL